MDGLGDLCILRPQRGEGTASTAGLLTVGVGNVQVGGGTWRKLEQSLGSQPVCVSSWGRVVALCS